MAILKTAVGCVLQAGFRLPGRLLAADDRVCFRAVLATQAGEALAIHERLASDGTGGAGGDHVTLRYDLADRRVLPGCYTWELTLANADGSEQLLLSKAGNALFVAAREETPAGEES